MKLTRLSAALATGALALGVIAAAQAATNETIVTVVKVTGINWFNRMDEGVKEFAKDNPGVQAYQTGPGRADAAQQRATELAEMGEFANAEASSEAAEGAVEAQPAAADPEEVETLKAQLAGEAAKHATAITEARENIKRWSEYANGLKQQLAQANEKAIVGLARSAGEASLSRRLATELGQVAPEHELLRKESQQQVVVEAVSAHLEQQGYAYDAKTGMVTKLSTENAPA